jgi:outer membrane protein OmpA-like peptidoglycan-associated protein
MKMKLGAVLGAALMAAPIAANAQGVPGFYVGIEGGINWLDIRVNGVNEKIGPAVGIFLGYDFVGPRVELEGVYRNNKVTGVSVDQWSGFVNLLYDFMADQPFSVHLGVGAGINHIDAGNFFSSTKFAMQGIVGVTYKFVDGLFLGADFKLVDTFVNGKDPLDYTGMIRIGYKFGPPAPAMAPPPPAPTTAQYIVFFDFDRANLTAQAMTTIRQAAAAAKAGNKTRIGVTGHADRSGSDAYNMALSLRRANAVKDALVREGIPATGITVVGRGESQPLVPTADGVREPQNRRVEIVLQ